MNSTDWYSLIKEEDNISQGDIIINCPIFFPKYPQENLENFKFDDIDNNINSNLIITSGNIADVIVMSQACDLEVRKGKEKPKLSSVLVAALRDVRKDGVGKSKVLPISQLRMPQYFLLELCNLEVKMNYQIVQFDALYTIPWDLLNSFCKKNGTRLRLKSPYIEQLSQHFGKYFSRVATPEDRDSSIEKYYSVKGTYEDEFKGSGLSKTWEQLSYEEIFKRIDFD